MIPHILDAVPPTTTPAD